MKKHQLKNRFNFSKLRKKTNSFLMSFALICFLSNSSQAQVYGYDDVIPASGSYSSASSFNSFVASITNPDIPSTKLCSDLKITFVLDESGSIAISNSTESVKLGVRSLANALLNSGAQLRIIEFSAESRIIDLGQTEVNSTFVTNLNQYLGAGFNGQSYNPVNATNWEDALEDVSVFDADLVFFFTDGYPTAYNGPNGTISVGGSATFPAALDAAVTKANFVKTQGKHMLVIGVGAGIELDNIIAISGPDRFGGANTVLNSDFSTPPFDQLASNLSSIVNTICGTELSLLKSVSNDGVCAGQEVTFTTIVKNTGGSFNYQANNVEISDVYPNGYSNIQVISPSTGVSVNGQTVSYLVDTLLVGQTITLVVTATVDAPPGDFYNVVTASAYNANTLIDSAYVLSGYATETLQRTSCNDIIVNGVTYTNSGSYTQTLVSAIGCDSILTIEYTRNYPSYSSEAETICNQYNWNGNNYTTSGVYSYVGTNAVGCDSIVTLNLTILNPPAKGMISGPSKVCRNQTGFTYTVSPVLGATSYTWILPIGLTGTSSTNSITISANSTFCPGTISVKANNECGSGLSATFKVGVITSIPSTPSCISGSTSVCVPGTYTYSISAVSNATEYVWTISGTGVTILSGQGTRTITVSFSSAFTSGCISVRSKNCFGQSCSKSSIDIKKQRRGCTSRNSEEEVEVSNNEFANESIRVFPNPASSFLNIKFETNDKDNVRIALVGANGKNVYVMNQKYSAGKQVKQINTANLISGTYFINVTKNNKKVAAVPVIIK